MNKILMDKKVIDIIDDTSDIKLEIKDKIYVINFFCNNQKNMNIDIIQNNNSTLIINYVSIIKSECKINIKILIKGDNNKSVVNVRSIGKNNLGNIDVCIHTNKLTKNNEIIEDLKGINEEGNIIFNPILEIESKEGNASHFATVGKFNENELFYLETKGINKKEGINLLKKNFIYGLFSKEFIDKLERSHYE